MTALVAVEAVAIVLLGVLVAGLLRSHADILRALHRLGVDPFDRSGATVPVTLAAREPATPAGRSISTGSGAFDVVGVSPGGDAVRVAVAGTQHDTLLTFLTSGCAACISFWNEFAATGFTPPDGARLVVVVHSPNEESVSRIRALAPPGVTVVMSSGVGRLRGRGGAVCRLRLRPSRPRGG